MRGFLWLSFLLACWSLLLPSAVSADSPAPLAEQAAQCPSLASIATLLSLPENKAQLSAAGSDALWPGAVLGAVRKTTAKQSLSPSDVAALIALSNTLVRGDGYANLLAADSLARLSIFELTRLVVAEKIRPPEASRLIESMEIAKLSTRKVLEKMLPDEQSALLKPPAGGKPEKQTYLFADFAKLGLNVGDVIVWGGHGELKTAVLAGSPSVPKLVWRLAETQSLLAVRLPGLIAFQEKGAPLSALDSSNTSAFKALLGKDVLQKCRYPSLGMNALSVSDIQYMLDLANDQKSQEVFMSQVF